MTADAIGGVWGYALTLAGELARRDTRVDLAVMGRAVDPAQRAEAAAVPGLVLHEADFALEWMDDPWRDVEHAGEWLLGLARALEPDLVHVNGYAHAALPWSRPVVVVAHSCVVSWWRAVHGEDPPARYDRYRSQVGRGLAHADRVVAPSRWMLDELTRCHGRTVAGVVIYNGLAPRSAAPARKEPIALAAGRLWDAAKNLALVAEAAPTMPWPVYAAGDGAATSADAAGPLRTLGELSRAELFSWMQRASIFLHPTRYEPFGLAPLEAARAGCALVLSDVPSLRELWGDAARYVSTDDPAHLAAQVRALTRDPEELNRMAQSAKQRSRRYSARRMGAAYAALYDELLGVRGEARRCA